MDNRIIDANLNRVSEGLRVIEEYLRFVCSHVALSQQIAQLRHTLNATETAYEDHLMCRNVAEDARAYAPPTKRGDMVTLLRANFKRALEGLRVLEEYTGNSTYNRLRYDLYMLEKEVVLLAEKPKLLPGVYLISDDPEILLAGVEAGAVVIQLRDKHATKAQIYDKALFLKATHHDTRIPLVINDHLDIALAIRADGLHTGQDDVPIAMQRQLLGSHRLIGRTTHDFEQGQRAVGEGADYISVGPIWETPSKPGRAGIGYDYLREVASLGIPYVAIGGISIATISDIAPYAPPMIGLIRAHDQLRELMDAMAGWGLPAKIEGTD
jgi:thiamine-phosphate pyrophosphorylase